MTNVYAPGLWPRKRFKIYTAARAKQLRDRVGVDPKMIADELHISVSFVRCYQRKLGLLRFSGTLRMGEPGWVSRAKKRGI